MESESQATTTEASVSVSAPVPAPASTSAASAASSLPSTMSAIQVTAYGDPSNTFQFESSIPIPRITGDHDVLIRVYSASINPVDYKMARGYLAMVKKITLPYTPGFDVAGEVIEVGKLVKDFKAGDRVYGDLGTYGKTMAEYCIGKDYQLAKIPASLTYSQAASIPLATITSYQGLFVHASLKAGQRVLILGGSSATGQSAIQLAKAAGAWVASTASTRNIELVQGLGADLVIDYTKQKWDEELKAQEKFHIVYDTVGEERSWERGSSLIVKDGIFIQIAVSGSPKLTVGGLLGLGFSITGRKIASLFGGPRYNFFMTDTSDKGNQNKQLEIINKWIEEGKYRTMIDKVFPFTKQGAIDLFHTSESGKARGKLVIEIIPPSTPTTTLSDSSVAAAAATSASAVADSSSDASSSSSSNASS